MKKTRCVTVGIGVAMAVVALSTLTGCVHERPHQTVYAPPYHAEPYVEVQDDYLYYPQHQVYYSGSRNQYIYLEGRSWVSRPTPPRVSVDVLFSSPSVRLDFRDSPARHHSRVVRQYPKHWRPSSGNHNDGPERWNHGRGNNWDRR